MIIPTETVAVSVKPDNSLLVTIGTDYNSDGQISGSEITSQYTLDPGDSLEGQPEQVVKIANALWTPAVIEAYKLTNPPAPEPETITEVAPARETITVAAK